MRSNSLSIPPFWLQLLSVIATEISRPAGDNSIKKFRPDEFISINRNIIYNFHFVRSNVPPPPPPVFRAPAPTTLNSCPSPPHLILINS